MGQLNTLEGRESVRIARFDRRVRSGNSATELTRAQHEVYELLLKGISTREIAEELERSEFTVRNHIKVIFKKLKVNSRAALMSASLGLNS